MPPIQQQTFALRPPQPFGALSGGPPSIASTLPPEYQQALGIQPPEPLPVKSAPDAPKPPGIAAPAPVPRAVALPSISPRVQQAEQAEDALRAQGGPQYHGKLGMLEKIGDVAGRLLAPGIEQRLGVGTIGYEGRLKQAEQNSTNAEKEAANAAATQKTGADAELAVANANKINNAPPPEAAPDVQAFDALIKKGTDPVEAFRQVTQAGIKTPPRALEHVTLTGANGKPMAANYDPATGAYTTADGSVIANPQPYVAPRTAQAHYAPVNGTLDGKPTMALFNSATGQYFGTDLKPLPAGFAPDQNKPLSAIEAAMLLRSMLSEGYRANPAILKAAADIAKTSGLGLTPDDIAAIGEVPEGQPTDTNGKPIGLAQPGAPTTSMRNQAQYSQGVLDQLGAMEGDIRDLEHAGKLGPIGGRFNEFMVGRIGADDPAFAKMRGDRDNLILAWSKAHGVNTDQARTQIGALLSAAQSGGNIQQALESIRRYANFYSARGSGNGAAGNGNDAARNQRPSGVGPDWVLMEGGGHQQWVAPGDVAAALKNGAKKVSQ